VSARLVHYSDVENAYDDPERIGRLAGTVRALRDGATLVCGTGDDTSPGVVPLVTEGGAAVPFFEAAGADLETLGNHDFDYGPERTLELIADSPQTWLTANVERDGGRFGAGVGTVPWTVETVGDRRVGLFGVTDPKTGDINPNATGLTFRDPVAAAREAVAELRERGVDDVVALSHLGRGDEELAVETDVDVILGGHVHTEVVERVADTLLTRPGVNGHRVLAVDLPSRTVERHDVADGPLDGDLRDRMWTIRDGADLDETVATVDDPVARDEAAAFRGESRIGNFVADAYRWATGADVGLQNSGGIREGPALAGAVTVADLVSVVPFEEPVAVVRLSGRDLLSTFEEADGAAVAFGEADWWHAHLSGARVTYDRADHSVVGATVGGDPVDPDGEYTVATSEYVVETGQEFPSLNRGEVVGTHDLQYEVLAEYARSEGVDPTVEGRIRRVDRAED
jgi:2',3'-cyclic-nucleotide 2'-phosphodiesterase (5'-nucleotidase family)